MTTAAVVAPRQLAPLLEEMYPDGHLGLTRRNLLSFAAALQKTDWAARHQRRFVLRQRGSLIASAVQSDLVGSLAGQPITICGVGAVFTGPEAGDGGARTLIERITDDAARRGARLVLLFLDTATRTYAPEGFEELPTRDVELEVARPTRYGAPMTMVRAGEERDLQAIVAMGDVRAGAARFHLRRDLPFVKHAITRKRLLAGLSPAGVRQLLFMIAEEGTTAAAYVVVSITGSQWVLEECGDRDPAGARVGALLQALIAREPAESRPTIRGWLPPGFVPPQITRLIPAASSAVVLARTLGTIDGGALGPDDVLYWRGDVL